MQLKVICFLVMSAIFTIGAAPRRSAPTLADVPNSLSPELHHLVEMTFARNAAARSKAARDIGAMGAAAAPAVPFLIRLLSDAADTYESDFGPLPVMVAAWTALEKIGKPAVGPCTAALKDASEDERDVLIDVLGRIGTPEALDVMLPLVTDRDEKTSLGAILSLRNCRDPRIVGPLVQALTKSPDTRVRQAAANGLSANVRDPRAVDALLVAMKDKDLGVRCAALASLGEQRDRRAVPSLLEVLQKSEDKELYVRIEAARSLGEIRDLRAFGPLLVLFKDQNAPKYLRSAAAEGLGLMGNREALPPLTVVLKDTSQPRDLRVEVIHAIPKLAGAESLSLLTQIAKSSGDGVEARFWAALEIVSITDGAIEDVEILSPLKGCMDQRQALVQKIILHGKNEAVRSAATKMLIEPSAKGSKH